MALGWRPRGYKKRQREQERLERKRKKDEEKEQRRQAQAEAERRKRQKQQTPTTEQPSVRQRKPTAKAQSSSTRTPPTTSVVDSDGYWHCGNVECTAKDKACADWTGCEYCEFWCCPTHSDDVLEHEVHAHEEWQ